MSKEKPLKRHEAIQPLSREHHHSLLLSWKIRRGFSNNVEPQRIKNYVDWFFKNHIEKHFQIEEKYVFPILGSDNELVRMALADHRRLVRLFTQEDDIPKALSLIEEELQKHIRFEERVLFPEIQKLASHADYQTIEKHHKEESFKENTLDEFWN